MAFYGVIQAIYLDNILPIVYPKITFIPVRCTAKHGRKKG